MKDKWGVEITTNNYEAVKAIELAIEDILRYGKAAGEYVTMALKADKECVIANCIGAYAYSFIKTDECRTITNNYLLQAKKSIEKQEKKITKRERRLEEAVAFFVRGLYPSASSILHAIVQLHPNDIFSTKLCQICYHFIGDVENQLKVVSLFLEKEERQSLPFINGMHAFALVETNNTEEAEIAGKKGAEITIDPWAEHAVAHVMDITGRVNDGIQWMESHSDHWKDCCSFMYTHNWWHTALYYLDKEDSDTVLGLYDKHVWGVWKEFYEDQIGAASLLWRCELRGIPVVERWEDVTDYIAPLVLDHVQPFVDMHYVYALARANKMERVNELISSLEETKQGCCSNQADVAIPLLKGLSLYATNQFDDAYNMLEPVIQKSKALGGSDAQLDVLHQTYLQCAIAANKLEESKSLLEDRLTKRAGAIPFNWQQLADVCAKLGDNDGRTKALNEKEKIVKLYSGQ